MKNNFSCRLPMLWQFQIWHSPAPQLCPHFYNLITIMPTGFFSETFDKLFDFAGGNIIQVKTTRQNLKKICNKIIYV